MMLFAFKSRRFSFATLVSSVLVFVIAERAGAVIDASLQMQLGNPSNATADSNNHNHYLIQRSVEALDYSDNLGEPVWASWDLTDSDVGGATRSGVYFTDTNLPAGFYRVTDDDYVGVGGIGFNRGHLCPSEDRTDTDAHNDTLFFMSNIMPQSSANNSGPWEDFEIYCRALATTNELLILCGPSGFGTSKIPSGVAYIPSNTWKIAVVVPLGSGTALSRITTTTNRVIAIKIPNVTNSLSAWQSYITTAHQIELDTGFAFFTALPGTIASAFRSRIDGLTSPPAPVISSFTPSSGLVNSNVVITGTNFNSASAVKFNGTSAVFTVNSNTNIVATVPTNATSGTISVTTPGGTATSASSFTVGTVATPNLAITATHAGNFTQGDIGDTYTIVVTNVGNAASTGTVTVSNVLPAGLTATAISGTGWATNLATLTATRSDALAAGSAYPSITVTVNVASNAPNTVTNLVTVSGGGDTNSANNTANDVITINSSSAPSVTTTAASGVGTNTATLNGTVNPNSQPSTAQFQYGLTTSYGSIASVSGTLTGSTAQGVSASLINLIAGTTYHFRLTASNILGTATGSDQTFTTTALPPSEFTGTLAGWDVSGQLDFGVSPLAASTNAPNISLIGVGLTRGSGVGTNGSGAAGGWGGNTWTNTSAATAIASNRFITFTVAANIGFKVSYSSISKFDYRRSSTGPANGLLQYQIGSGAFTDITNVSYSSTSSAGGSIGAIDLSSIAVLENVGAATNVTFRIVNWGGTSSAGTWYVYDVVNDTAPDFAIQGTVSTVITNAPVLQGNMNPGGSVLLNVQGLPGVTYWIKAATNLGSSAVWQAISTNVANTNGLIQFTDMQATNYPRRFYRAFGP